MKQCSPSDLARALPTLEISDQDRDMLRDLSRTLVAHNLQQSNTLVTTKSGTPDSTTSRWKEMRRKDNLRIYRERPRSIRPDTPFTPSLLLLGTLEGTVEDVMYGALASTDAAMKIKSACVQDGMLEGKVLQELVTPSEEDPFRHESVKWRLFNGRDYVSLDATGILYTTQRERMGYSLQHSLCFAEIPSFEATHGISRGNMSVCSLYRQKTPTTVECYVRGFFDFCTQNEMKNNLALQALASQWLSFARKVECSQMKKLVWRLRKNSAGGRSSDDSSASTCSSYGSAPSPGTSPSLRPGLCSLCCNRFGFLGTSRETCASCMQSVCLRCCEKKLVCAMAPDGTTVLEKRRAFCVECIGSAADCDAATVAWDEISSEFTQPMPMHRRTASGCSSRQMTTAIAIPKRGDRLGY